MFSLNFKKLNIVLLTAAIVLFAAAAYATVDPMYIGVGARPLGMGKAYVAVAEDADTIFINPAGLGRIESPKLTSMYANLLGDVRYVVLGGVYPGLPVGVLGGGVVSTSVSKIYLYDAGGNPLGTADYGNNVFFLSYGLDLGKTPQLGVISDYGKNIQIGTSLKYFSQGGTGDVSLEAGNGTGMDMDLGVLYTPMTWLSVGYTQTNLLSSGVYFKESGAREGIPSVAKLGIKVGIIGKDGLYTFDSLYGGGYQKLNLAMDYDMSADDRVAGTAHFGVEYYPIKYLALRFGLDQDPAADGVVTNPTAGIGFRYDGVEFNYAYHPYDGISENATHFFSISYVGPEEEEKAPVTVAPKKESRIRLDEPADKTITHDSKIDVSGTVQDYNPGTTISVNNINLGTSEIGDFSMTLKLTNYGKTLVKVLAVEPDGNKMEESARILRLLSFSDVTGDYWSRSPIEYSATIGLVEGYPDGTFKPERALSRAELATLLVRAKGVDLPKVEGNIFSDLSASHWAARYVAAAQEMGLVKGYPDGTFRPNDKISRAEGVLVFARFEGLKEPESLSTGPYVDVPAKHWAATLISAAKDAQFLDYIKSEFFRPKDDLPRSEAVYILAKTTFAKKKIDDLLNWGSGFEESQGQVEPALQGEVVATFKDVPEGYWAATPIQELATAGIISGFPDGTFRPEKTLSRAELSTLLVKARGVELPAISRAPFADVATGHWASRYIKAAVDLGLAQGYPDGTFKPNKILTRAEAITVVDRFDGIEVPDVVLEEPFPDVPLSNWAARFISAGLKAGILDYLKGKNFEPNREMTRAEAAEMLSKTKFGKSKIEEVGVEEPKGPTAKYKITYGIGGQHKADETVVQ